MSYVVFILWSLIVLIYCCTCMEYTIEFLTVQVAISMLTFLRGSLNNHFSHKVLLLNWNYNGQNHQVYLLYCLSCTFALQAFSYTKYPLTVWVPFLIFGVPFHTPYGMFFYMYMVLMQAEILTHTTGSWQDSECRKTSYIHCVLTLQFQLLSVVAQTTPIQDFVCYDSSCTWACKEICHSTSRVRTILCHLWVQLYGGFSSFSSYTYILHPICNAICCTCKKIVLWSWMKYNQDDLTEAC